MTPFEQELKRALARREPEAGFAARVMDKIVEDERQRHSARWRLPQWSFAFPSLRRFAAIAVFALVLAFTFVYRQHVRRERGEAAKRQLMAALHIAGAQLREAQLRVKRIEFPEVVMQ